jgi:hypothetical protein
VILTLPLFSLTPFLLQVKNFVEQVVAGIIYSFDLELGPAEEATAPVSLSLWSLKFRDASR